MSYDVYAVAPDLADFSKSATCKTQIIYAS